MTKSVGALFDGYNDAQHAVNDLIQNNFAADNISMVVSNAADRFNQYFQTGKSGKVIYTDEDAVTAGEGAGFGALVGMVTGILAGIAAITIPGIGPIVALGPIAGGLTGGALGAATGAATGGLIAAFVKTGYTEEEAETYLEGVRRGAIFVTVDTTDMQADRAQTILSRNNAIDVAQRSMDWKTSGWKGYDPDADPYIPESPELTKTPVGDYPSTTAVDDPARRNTQK